MFPGVQRRQPDPPWIALKIPKIPAKPKSIPGGPECDIVFSMKRLKPVDVVIVGGGFTGLLMAKEITARTSHSVVILERGPGPEKRPVFGRHGRTRLRGSPAHDAESRR